MPITRKDFTGLTDQYLDTTAYNLDPQFQTMYLRDPKEIDMRRLKSYQYFMDFYRGRHWEESGEFNPAYGSKSLVQEEYNRRTWNMSQNIVDKLVSFLVKEEWKIKLPEELEDANSEVQDEGQDVGPEESKPFDSFEEKAQEPRDPMVEPKGDEGKSSNPVHDLLEQVWTANRRHQFSYDMANMGMITGDCFIKVSYDPDFYGEDMGELKFDVLDSRTVQPYFDSLERTRMVGCRIQYPVKMRETDAEEDGGMGGERVVMYREIHTDTNIYTFLDDELQDAVANPLGEMMVVHIKNEPLPFERYGRSVLYNLIMPNKEFNEKVSDFSEILAYHAAPVTIIKGARVQNLEKGARKVWGGIPKDGDVYNLNLDADLSSSVDYLDKLKTFIHETGAVPPETMSNLQAISNTSGSALHLQYQPILDRIQRMQINYGEGLKQINRLILRFYEAVGIVDLPEDVGMSLKYKTVIEWGDALPRDRSIDLADISTEMGLGIESKRGALKRLGEENPDAKLEEIKQETMEQAEMDFMSTGLSGFGDPSAGPDGMGGAASGADDGTQNDVAGATAAAKTNPNTQGNQTSVQAVKKSAQTTTNANRVR